MKRRDPLAVWILAAVLILGLGATGFGLWLVGATKPPAPLPEPHADSPRTGTSASLPRPSDPPTTAVPAAPDTPNPKAAPQPEPQAPTRPAPEPPAESAPPPPSFTPRPPSQSEQGDDIPPSVAPPRELRPQLETAHLDAQALARMFTSLLR